MERAEPRAAEASAGAPGLGRGLKWAILGACLLGAAAVLYVIIGSLTNPASQSAIGPLRRGAMAKLEPAPAGAGYPAVTFVDSNGQPVRLSQFKGVAVVLNLWATWCAPCKKEMPTLAALQKAYAGRPVKVVAVSLDGPTETGAARAFIAANAPLSFYQDPKQAFVTGVAPPILGFPTTLLFDRQGHEVAIMKGEADWASPEARAVIDKLISG